MPYYKKSKQYKKRQRLKKKVEQQKNVIDSITSEGIKAFNERLDALEIHNPIGDKHEAHGVAIHSIVNKRTSSTFLGEVNDYSDANLDDRETVVKLARNLRSREGICSTVADLLADFAVTKGSFYCDNKKLQFILNKWANFVNSAPQINLKGIIFPVPGIRALSRKIFDDYVTDGDSIFVLYWQKNIQMDPKEKSLFLPISIRTIDSLITNIDPKLAQLGIERIELKLTDDIKKKILDPETEADKFLAKTIPPEWKKFLNKKEEIILDPNVTYHLKRNAKDYKPYGESLFVKAFTAIANKRRLQAVDEATIDGLINRFTIFKLGLPDSVKNAAYHIPSGARVQALIDILTTPKRANAAVWPGPDLDVIDIGPDGKILEFVDKYKQADTDIMRALHVAPLLIDGGSSGQSMRDWAAFISTEVGLDAIRDELEKIITMIGKDIAIANNIKFKDLYYKFDTQLLKDEKRVRNFALKVYELGGISTETFLKTMGYDFEAERQLKEKEMDEGLQEIFVNRSLPFQGKPDEPPINPEEKNIEPDGKPLDRVEDQEPEDKSVAFVKGNKEFYEPIIKNAFDKIKEDLNRKRKFSENDFYLLELSLISGFVYMKKLIEAEIKDIFYLTIGEIGVYQEELEFLLLWNEGYLDNFYNELHGELRAAFKDYDLFNNILDKQDYRISLYAQESARKAEAIAKFAMARKKGFEIGYWIATIDNRTCPICIDRNGNYFTIKELFNNYPGHVNCRCEIQFHKFTRELKL